jgi:hypothetical protein
MQLHLILPEADWLETAKRLNLQPTTFPPKGAAHLISWPDALDAFLCANLDTETLETAYSQILHEVIHVWQAVKLYIGETKPGHEVEAYFIQSYADLTFTHYKTHRTNVLALRKAAPRKRGAIHPKLLSGTQLQGQSDGLL